MKKIGRILLVLSLLSLALLTAAAPTASARSTDLTQLTIENQSATSVYLWLTGPHFYYFAVPPETTTTYTPIKGEYSYQLTTCSVTVSGTLDLTKQHKLLVPPCGLKGGGAGLEASTTDTSQLIKLVRIELTNGATSSMLMIFTGPETFVFYLKEGQTKEYTIPKGEYDYVYYACGGVKYGTFLAYAHHAKEFSCP